MKLNFGTALISGFLLAGSIVSGAAHSAVNCVNRNVPPQNNLLKQNGVSTPQDAQDYYATIDPSNERLTQTAWRTVNGFDPGSGNEVIVVGGHKNVSDLGFFRRIEMVIDKRPGKVGNVAMTTFNYLCEDDALNNTNALSIVNMEYSPGPNGKRITKFYIYDANGARKLSTIFDPAIGAEELNLPNGCAACHGGGKDFRGTRAGNTGGGFLAFDFNVFEYSGLFPNNDRAHNEVNVKKLNQGVLLTKANAAVKDLISGLYGGSRLPRAAQNTNYMPADWAARPDLAPLWRVVVTDCQGCHTLSEEEVRQVRYWQNEKRSIRELIFTEQTMPNSPEGFRRFWNTNNHTTVLNALDNLLP